MFSWLHKTAWLLVALLIGVVLSPYVARIFVLESEPQSAGSLVDGVDLVMQPITSFADSVRQAESSVVDIYTSKKGRTSLYSNLNSDIYNIPSGSNNSGIGSGVIIDEDGYIVTSYHVVAKADNILVGLHSGENLVAKVIGSDPETDLTVLKIDSDSTLSAIGIANSDELRNGDIVLAIGNPFGIGKTATMGIVSATGRSDLGISVFESFIQTDAAINPGNSGGALINTKGQLVGINSAIFSRNGTYQGIGFAAPSNQVLKVTENLIASGQVIRGWLGISIHTVFDISDNGSATEVIGIFPGGPAEEIGLLPGDLLVSINQEDIGDASSAQDIISAQEPGANIHLEVLRDDEQLSFRATIGQRPMVTQ